MKKRILVVDDSSLVSAVISKFLNDHGYETLTASNGIEAIEETFKELPDLILLDVMMPRMNGYQTCRLLKSDPETCAIPIIMLTVKDQASDKYWGIQTGADAYLSKDVVQTSLLGVMAGLINRRPQVPPARSIIRQHSFINALDIVAKVNDLLDKKLFEATVLNEMSSLVERGIKEFEEIVNIVTGTLAKILDFNVAAIVAMEEYDVECFFKINHPVSKQYLNNVQEHTKRYLRTQDIEATQFSVITTFDPGRVNETENPKEQKIVFFEVPIKHGDKLGGLVILAHNASEEIDAKEEDFFKVVIKQAFIIIENSWLYGKVRKLAITDSLTGIYNHGFLYEGMAREFARVERLKLPLSFLMLDIDYFKKINDTYGHLQGDEVLRKLAQILKKNTRPYDILGRYGGEEFSIVMPEANREDSISLAERIRTEVSGYNFGSGDETIKCTISIGISNYPHANIKNIEDLINKADRALYRAKAEGRNRVCTSSFS